jgi:hypothetical protein
VVIWQIGCVGDMGFNFAGYDNRNLHTLVDYLEETYSPDQEVIHYQGSQYPTCAPCVQKMRLDELRTAQVTGISTLYIGPASVRPTDREMAVRLGLSKKKKANAAANARPTDAAKPYAPSDALRAQYARYIPVPDHSALADYISDMMVDPVVLAAFRRNPELASRIFADLNEHERAALISGHPGRIRMAVKIPYDPASVQIHQLHFADRPELTNDGAALEHIGKDADDVARRVLEDVAARISVAAAE